MPIIQAGIASEKEIIFLGITIVLLVAGQKKMNSKERHDHINAWGSIYWVNSL